MLLIKLKGLNVLKKVNFSSHCEEFHFTVASPVKHRKDRRQLHHTPQNTCLSLVLEPPAQSLLSCIAYRNRFVLETSSFQSSQCLFSLRTMVGLQCEKVPSCNSSSAKHFTFFWFPPFRAIETVVVVSRQILISSCCLWADCVLLEPF